MPIIIIFFSESCKPWEKDGMIQIPIEEGPFGIAFNLFVFKDDITQIFRMQQIRAVSVTLYVR